MALCLKLPLVSHIVCAISEGSGETAQMCRFALAFTIHLSDKYSFLLNRLIIPNPKSVEGTISQYASFKYFITSA